MEREYYVVDAFAAERFSGNPAAVLFEADGLADDQMRAIAAEFNLSETTFVLPPSPKVLAMHGKSGNLPVQFRWFTPMMEVSMCGHATIAGVHALLESGRFRRGSGGTAASLRIETRSGVLAAFVEPVPGAPDRHMIWLDLVDPTLTPLRLVGVDLASVLELPVDAFDPLLPAARTQDHDAIVFVQDVGTLNSASPDFQALKTLLQREKLRGLSLATVGTLTPSVHVQSRFFAPLAGIEEDPVTGSVHGPLAAHLVQHGRVPLVDGLAGLTCVQGKAGGRAGLLHALVQVKSDGSHAVRIGGRAITTMRGTLFC